MPDCVLCEVDCRMIIILLNAFSIQDLEILLAVFVKNSIKNASDM